MSFVQYLLLHAHHAIDTFPGAERGGRVVQSTIITWVEKKHSFSFYFQFNPLCEKIKRENVNDRHSGYKSRSGLKKRGQLEKRPGP